MNRGNSFSCGASNPHGGSTGQNGSGPTGLLVTGTMLSPEHWWQLV